MTLTIDQLVLWFAKLGFQKVEPTLRGTLLPEVAAVMREAGEDPDSTCWITQPPQEGPYFYVTHFSADDTRSGPVMALSVTPFREEVPESPGSVFCDGRIGFTATPDGKVESFEFGESYSGRILLNSEEEGLALPTTLADLQSVFELYRKTFTEFCCGIDEGGEQ